MSLAQDVFEEHVAVISALKENYARKDDASTVLGIVRAQEEIAQLCTCREEQVKQSIKQLSERVQEAHVQATYPDEEGAHAARVGNLTLATEEAKENVNRLNEELRYLQQQREVLKEKVGELRQRSDQLEQLVNDTEPRTRHQLSLYAHISKVTWHLDKRDKVAGTVSNTSTGDICKFELDPQELGDFEVVNQLWDMIDGR
ncbi:hypothetical protein N2152v2_006104 [Parachlorella kessleri]